MVKMSFVGITAAQRVLLLPELVETVIEQLAAVEPEFFRRTPPAARQSIIAPRICAIRIERWGDYEVFTQCAADLSFPRLRYVDMGHGTIHENQLPLTTRRLVSLRLLHLGFSGGGKSFVYALGRLGGAKSKLCELHVKSLSYEVSADRLVHTLQYCRLSLRTVTYEAIFALPLPWQLLSFFAACPALCHLLLEKLLDKAAAQAVVASAAPEPAFASLQRLHLDVHPDAVPLLATMLPCIEELLLQCDGVTARCHVLMPANAQLRRLRCLQLKFCAAMLWLRHDELLELRSLTALQSLKLLALPGMLQSANMGDAHVLELMAAIG
jgi:hypothetical protein